MNRIAGTAFIIIVALLCVSVVGVAFGGDDDRAKYGDKGAVLSVLGVGETFSIGSLTYTVENDISVSVAGDMVNLPTGSIDIPATVTNGDNTYDVTKLGDNAFRNCTGITSVTIPDSVTSIGGNVFGGCTRLSIIDVDASNENYCSQYGILFDKPKTDLIQCPRGKTGTYAIPDSVTSIGNGAFNGCTGLTSVTITLAEDDAGGVLSGGLGSTWNLPGMAVEGGQIDTIIIDAGQEIDLSSIAPTNGKVIAIVLGTDNASIGSRQLTGGLVYTGNGTSFMRRPHTLHSMPMAEHRCLIIKLSISAIVYRILCV